MAENLTPEQIGAKLTEVINKASKTKKRHDALIIGIGREKSLQGANFDYVKFVQYLDRKLLPNEGIILSGDALAKLFGVVPHEKTVAYLQDILMLKDLHIAPIYKNVGENKQAIVLFLVIHRKIYQALEYADDIRGIITGKPREANARAWLVGIAIKITEEISILTQKVRLVSKYDVVDAVQLLRNEEVYFISSNFCMFYNIDPRDLLATLESKGFYVQKLLSEDEENKEPNPVYKEFAALLGILVSREEKGIAIGQNNLDTIFRISENIDSQLSRPEIPNGTVH